MKIKKSELKQIIQEEIETVIAEKKWSKGQIKPQSPEHRDAIIAADPTMLDEPDTGEKSLGRFSGIQFQGQEDAKFNQRKKSQEEEEQLREMVRKAIREAMK